MSTARMKLARTDGSSIMGPDYDFFVSYARADNQLGFVKEFVDGIVEEHQRFSGGRVLSYFFDTERIPNFASWETEIFQKHLVKSRLFLAFLSPAYFASDICRREWRAWIDREIASHQLSEGAAPVFFVEVPGLYSKPMLSELQVAEAVARLCGQEPRSRFLHELAPVIKEIRRRQVVAHRLDNAVRPFHDAGRSALRKQDLGDVLAKLARDLDQRSQDARRAAESENEVPAYNEKFTGRLDELLELRRALTDKQTGVIAGIHGLGGIGKTELAFTYAHAFAGVYPGGRFLVRCEFAPTLRSALLQLGEYAAFHGRIRDEERNHPETYFRAVLRCLKERIARLGHVLLVLDNVAELELLSGTQTDEVTTLGPGLHLLATTRLAPRTRKGWLTLGELAGDEALALLERYRPFDNDGERGAAARIVEKLGGFALAIELVAAGLAAHPGATYADLADGIGLDDLATLAEDGDIELRRHNHERRLRAVLGPTLRALSTEQLRTLELASFLPPDLVPLPWLRELVLAEFPELAQRDRMAGDRWENLVDQLVRLGLFTRIEQESTNRRLVRVHRLVQQFVRADLAGLEPKEYQRRISTHALARAVVVRVHGSRGAVVGVGTAISVRDAGDGRG
jgi:hypothetical protein